MTVYVITKGDYSDYHIAGVALTKERAEEICKLKSDWCDQAQIEEFDTEEIQARDYKQMWKCSRYENGIWTVIPYFDTIDRIDSATFGMGKYDYQTRKCDIDYELFFAYIAAPDEEHALKKAQDMYAKRKAEVFEL